MARNPIRDDRRRESSEGGVGRKIGQNFRSVQEQGYFESDGALMPFDPKKYKPEKPPWLMEEKIEPTIDIPPDKRGPIEQDERRLIVRFFKYLFG
jgi:hypothetical protein